MRFTQPLALIPVSLIGHKPEMRLLFLLAESPFPSQWGPHVHYNSLLKAACNWADCGVVGFWRGESGLARWQEFAREYPQVTVHNLFPENTGIARMRHRANALLEGCPLGLGDFINPAANSVVKRVIEEHSYDVTILSVHKLLYLREAASQKPVVLIPFDAHSMAYHRGYKSTTSLTERLRFYFAYLAFRNMEKHRYRQFTLVAPVSGVDCRWLRAGCSGINLQELPIAIEDSYFANRQYADETAQTVHLVCGGVYATTVISDAIVSFCVDSYPQLKRKYPQLRVTVWGRGDAPEKLRRCLESHPEIRSLTWSNDYLREVAQADIYLYPQQFASGIQTKVQHLMAAGIPVVARRETLEPLGVEHGKSGFIFDSAESLTSALSLLIERPELREAIGLEGRERMLRHYSMQTVSQVFKSMLTAIVVRRQ
jgi:hypothetical protein